MTLEEFPTLAILPWCRLKDDIKLGQVVFVDWQLGVGASRDLFVENDKLETVMSSYVDVHGQPIDRATIAMHKDAKTDGSISAKEIQEIGVAAQLLAFAAIAQNKYFPLIGQGTNSTCFRVIYQRIAEDNGIAISISHRCTGGILDGGWKHGDVHFTLPLQCQYVGEVNPAGEFVKALAYILNTNSSMATRLLRVIRLFTYAYTDDSYIPAEQEVIMLMMAFEGLFRNCQGRNDLACKVSTLLDEYGMITIGEANRKINKAKGLSPGMWLHRAWMYECYQLRNDYVHGNPPKSLTWSEYEHLVFASWLFPYLVKLLLSSVNEYELTKQDVGSLHAIDFILDTNDWNTKPKNENLSNWQLAERKGTREAQSKEIRIQAAKYHLTD